ncbi:sugar lactone lactonase YvrE [Kibdelosporangium banguiense]|uniref:Sugar lactone lactonase YvrE n=1 Tax=Kibdelosporangium banguiense TaxID=1365924 RepID=A0ABS4TSA5_9PSEU|nr:family 16 glycoside hydrolase [Kibdelosporangium banguiense]MBP2326874.1 sugar lactone lactonase YvrE [Kibdelosporangium banguiense]
MRSSSRRKRLPLVLTFAAVLFGQLPANAAADVPPQQPGVTLRVFDVQVPLDSLCTLKPAQTPNVDKLMPVIDWTTATDFGFEDRFVAQVTGNINISQAGAYVFRLISDDGSRLSIDSKVVVDHDGLHGATPQDGAVSLTAGYHSLLIDHFERDGGQQLTLQWKPPGAANFALVPNSVLSTDKEVVRVTAPGRKDCVASTDTPGDGLPLDGVHPGFTLTNLRPNGFEPKVSAMDWLPDGRLAIATWDGKSTNTGEVWVLGNVTGATSPDRVTTTRVASGLKEPMGLKVVDGKMYVSQKHELTELNDLNNDGLIDQYRTVATWPYGGNFHEFAFGLLYQDGFFYLNLSVAINEGGATTTPQPAVNRGSAVKVNRSTGEVTYIAGGLRTPNGLGWGPEGGLFVNDNQGGWLPASKLVQIKQDRFFNHYTQPAGKFDANPVTAPVLWLPQNEIANSPSTPVLLTQGRYAGQMVFGDVTYGGLQRAYLEKVNGEYQGAVFRMTQGLEAGVNRISIGPDGAIYAGGIGDTGNWGQNGKLKFGLQKLTPNGDSAFDMQAMRAIEGGFEIEYNQRVSYETAADLVSHYKVKQWRYAPSPAYGGPKVDQETLTVTSATLAADGRTVTLKINGLKPGRVVHLRSPRPFTSRTGVPLWSTEAWYTLNSLVGAAPSTTQSFDAESAALSGGAKVNTDHTGYTGSGFVDGYGTTGATTRFAMNVATAGTYSAALRYSNGPNPSSGNKTVSLYVNGTKLRQSVLASTGDWETWATHTEMVPLKAGANTIAYKVDSGDVGHVNLDQLTVAPAQRVTLFDGTGLGNWQKPDGSAATWPVADGSMESLGGDIRSRAVFGDFKLHAEFWLPLMPPEVTGQQRANSGIYIQDRYEVQILDSFGKTPLADNDAASIYLKKAASTNAGTAPRTWQTYDITFRAARFDSQGNKTENARVTVVWNGTTVHQDFPIDGPTGAGAPEGPSAGPIRLQDHNDPGENVRFRNVWIEPLG